MTTKRLYFLLGTLGAALLFMISGVTMLAGGIETKAEIRRALVSEKLEVQDPSILLTYKDARAPQGVDVPKVIIDTGEEADLQAKVIRVHVMNTTGGKTWSELPRQIDDPANPGKKIDNPARNTFIQGLTLQNSLHQAHIGFEISKLVIALGIVFTAFGAIIAFFGLPAVYLFTGRKS